MLTPEFNPPSTPNFSGDLNSRIKSFFEYFRSYQQYVFDYVQKLRTTLLVGTVAQYQVIASASSITPLQLIQPVTGALTINTINTPNIFGSQLVLLSEGGFVLGTTGNIAVAKTTVTGDAVVLYFNFRDSKWYPK